MISGVMGRCDEARARSAVYRLLSAVFLREPTAALLEGLAAQGAFRTIFESSGRWAGQPAGMDFNSMAKELRGEYTRLLLGPGVHVYPYESLYPGDVDGSGRSRVESLLYGEVAIAVDGFYRQADIAFAPSFQGFPDHIGVELECMAHLTDREARCWEWGDGAAAVDSLKLQRDFLGHHLVLWLPKFSRRVRKFPGHPFYISLATAASRFTKMDLAAVDELLREYVAGNEETGDTGEIGAGVHSSH